MWSVYETSNSADNCQSTQQTQLQFRTVSIGVPKLGTFKVSNFILGNVQAMVTAQRSVVTMTPQVAKAAMDPSSETQFVLQEDPQFWTNSKVSK